ncbi:DegT/DnrJ/EryC1/StrS family aminotransferase, partial [Brenneria goodwinii]
YHIMPVLLPHDVDRQTVIDHLRTKGIQTTIHYTPVHQMTLYRQMFTEIHLPKTEDFAQRELTIPLHPQITASAIESVVVALATAIESSGRAGAAA